MCNLRRYTLFDVDPAAPFYGSGEPADLANTIHDSNHSFASLDTNSPYNGPQSSPQEDCAQYSFDVREYPDEFSLPPLDDVLDAYLFSPSSPFNVNGAFSRHFMSLLF